MAVLSNAEKLALIEEANAKKEAYNGVQCMASELNEAFDAYLTDRISTEQFESFAKRVKTPIGENLETTLMRFIHSPSVNEVIDRYLINRGLTPAPTPENKAFQVQSVAKKLQTKFKRNKRQKFVGSDENFEAFAGTESFNEEMQSFVEANERMEGFDGSEGFDSEHFEAFLPAVLPVAKGGSKIAMKAVKAVGKKMAEKKQKDAKSKAKADNAEARANTEFAKAEAIRAGVPPEIVEQVASRVTKDVNAKTRSNLAITGKLLEKAIPQKIMNELAQMKNRYVEEQTRQQVNKMIPIMIIGIVAIIIITLFIAKK